MDFHKVWIIIHELFENLKWLVHNHKDYDRFSTEIIEQRKQKVRSAMTELTIVFNLDGASPPDPNIGLTMLEDLGTNLPPND
ncbi:MAG: hypothetical protein RLZZ223_219 [Candidatus Parcubacteria bacterium]|jgi:hypothetical protein